MCVCDVCVCDVCVCVTCVCVCDVCKAYLDDLAKGTFADDFSDLISISDVIMEDLDVAAVVVIIAYKSPTQAATHAHIHHYQQARCLGQHSAKQTLSGSLPKIK